jgi:hypothetical protein
MANEIHIKTTFDNTDTIKGMVQQRKELKGFFETAKVGSREYLDTGKQIEQLENRLHTARRQAYGDQGKIKEAYFNSGAALRQFYMEQRVGDRTMREAASTVKLFAGAFGVGGLAGGLEQAMNAFQQSEFAINSLGIAAEGAGGKVGQLGTALIGMGVAAVGPLAALAGEIMIIKGSFDQVSESADRYREAMIKAGLLSSRGEKLKDLAKIKPRSKVFGMNISSDFLRDMSITFPWLAPVAAAGYADADMNRRALQAELSTTMDEMTITGQRGGTPAQGPGSVRYGPGNAGQYGLNPLGTGISMYSKRAPQVLGGVEAKPSSWSEAEQVSTGINKNVEVIGKTLANSLSEGFMRGFQTGENMLTTFTQSVLASIAGIAAQQAAIAGISGILSLIPGVGTFGAIAGAMGSIFAGGKGASASPLNGVDVTNGRGGVVGQLEKLNNSVNSLSLRVDNQGLYMGAERGRVAFERS